MLAINQAASFIGKFCLNKEAVVLRDFYLLNISWHAETSLQHSSTLDTMFTDVINVLGIRIHPVGFGARGSTTPMINGGRGPGGSEARIFFRE